MNPDFADHPGWKWCTFEGAELNSLLVGLETTFREKIIWMEQMQAFHDRFAEGRARRVRDENRRTTPQG